MAVSAALTRKQERLLSFRPFAYLASLLQDRFVASVAPSSAVLSDAICRKIDFASARTIVEYGAGEGAVTKALLKKMRPDARLYAFETNDLLARFLKHGVRDERLVVIHGDARNILAESEARGMTPDAVVSGIPFSMFSYESGLEIMKNTFSAISKRGVFIIYQTRIPPFITSKRCRQQIATCFNETGSQNVFLNIPPVAVITAQPKIDRPRH